MYSLNVEGGTYIADGLVTHNSIYQFRGSVTDLNEIASDCTPYHLDTNYRSYQEITDYAEWARGECKKAMDKKAAIDFSLDLPQLEYNYDYSTITCERELGGKVYQFTNPKEGNQIFPDIGTADPKLIILELLKDNGTQILCRGNKQVKRLEALGITRVSTVHQAKGLEYDNVIVVGFEITSLEELNIMYVAMTRAKKCTCNC